MRLRLVARLNAAFKTHFVGTLLLAVSVGALFPAVGLWLKELQFFRIPGTGWHYDFPNLALGVMMLSAILGCRVAEFRRVLERPRPALLTLAVVYGVIPAIAASAALLWMRFSPQPDVQVLVGLMLSALMPVAMTSSVWVRMTAGNVPLLLALITVTTALSVISVPLYLQAMLGVSGVALTVPTGSIVEQLVVSVTLPLVIGLLAVQLAPKWTARLQDAVTLLGNLALVLVVMANVAVAAPHVLQNSSGFVAAVLLAVGLNVVSYAVGLLAARAMRLSHEDSLTLLFGAGMRSNSTGLMLGLKGFPGMPLVSVPAAVYMISQHLIGAYLARKLERPGSRLMGTTVAVERRSLEAYLGRALPELPVHDSPGVALVVIRMFRRQGGLGAAEINRLVRLVRHRVRQSDFVCLMGEDTFGLVLMNSQKVGVYLVLERLVRAASAFEPGLELSHGAVHCTDGRPTAAQVIEAASRASSLRAAIAGHGVVRLVG